MNVHKLKEVEPFFSDVLSGKKQFELRPESGNFQVGDMLLICQFVNNNFTGLDVQKTVTYILKDCEGLQEGYVLLGLKDYVHDVDTSKVPVKVNRESFDFLQRTMIGDCPHCGKHIARSGSPERCSECGSPVIWSENKYGF